MRRLQTRLPEQRLPKTRTESNSGSGGDQGIQVIARAATILRELKTASDGLSLGQIAKRVDLPRSTVQRIVNALISERFIVASASEGGLRLGPEIHSMAKAAKHDIVELIHPILVDLSQATGETVDLAELRDNTLVFIDQVEGSHRLRTVSAIGDEFPLTDTANGKAVLSVMTLEEAEHLIHSELDIHSELEQTENSTSGIDKIFLEIEQAHKLGYSLDLDEHTSGISAIGAAFTDHSGTYYAISVPVPSQRFVQCKDLLIEHLLDAITKARDVAE